VSDDLHETGDRYQIAVAGMIDESWLHLLGPVALLDTGERSLLLAVVPDQVALRRILDRIWDLNLVLLSVTFQPEAAAGSGRGSAEKGNP